MKKNIVRPLFILLGLLAVTLVGLAYSETGPKPVVPISVPPPMPVVSGANGLVSITGRLSQAMVYSGGNGTVSLALDMTAAEIPVPESGVIRHADLVIVLDRSGSMEGQKIRDAKRAIHELIANLGPKDRLALISYSDNVIGHTGLVSPTESNLAMFRSVVDGIQAHGSTNLGGGLQTGIDLLRSAGSTGNQRKIILISDGLANRGITDPNALGQMAASAVRNEFSISTVGVGLEFNENLMTLLADRGTGTYYFLENPIAFAKVFQKELTQTRQVAASGLKVVVPLPKGVTLIDAGGYPIETPGNKAVFYPGDLLSGQTRKLFLTFKLPTDKEQEFELTGISLNYKADGKTTSVTLDQPFKVACVKDQRKATASIDKAVWEKKVIQEDYNRLRDDVAKDLKSGRKEEAMKKIDLYYQEQSTINQTVQSEEVNQNLDRDVEALRQTVDDTFTGTADEIATKQKGNSKAMQHEGYLKRRSK
jgi:Ca-activated chloride channel family protein